MMCEAHLGVEWQQVQREPRSCSCFSHSTGGLFNVSASSPHLPVRDSANKVNIVPQAATQAFSLTRQRNLGAPAVPHPEMGVFFRKKETHSDAWRSRKAEALFSKQMNTYAMAG